MARKTRIRGAGTRAADKYDPSSESLATDSEVEQRARKHSEIFHNAREQVTKLIKDDDGILTHIKKYNNADEDILLQNSEFSYSGTLLQTITQYYYDTQGNLYMQLKKTFEYNGSELTGIRNEKEV